MNVARKCIISAAKVTRLNHNKEVVVITPCQNVFTRDDLRKKSKKEGNF